MTGLRKSPNTFPLYALFILLAACAVFFRLLAPFVHRFLGDPETIGEVAARMIIGLVLTVLIGVGVGLCHYRRARGLFIGMVIGALVGPLLGALTMMSPQDAGWFLLIAVLMSCLMIAVATYIRMKSPAEAGEIPNDHSLDEGHRR